MIPMCPTYISMPTNIIIKAAEAKNRSVSRQLKKKQRKKEIDNFIMLVMSRQGMCQAIS